MDGHLDKLHNLEFLKISNAQLFSFPASIRERLAAAGTTSAAGLDIAVSDFMAITKPKQFSGLGDAVAAVANPIAKAIDAVAGTQIQGCASCAGRQSAWNELLPFN